MNNNYLIEGNNVHVYKYEGVTLLGEIVCATTMELIKELELIGATTPDSDQVRERRPRLLDTSLNLSGASTSTNDGNVSIFYMSQNIRESHDLLIVFTDNGGTQRTFRQNFYIESMILNGNAGEAAQYDLALKGSGSYVESELDDPDVVEGDNITSRSYTVAGGKIQDNDWIGLVLGNIIEVCREGSEQLSLGLPYSFNGTTGEITPDPGTTIDGQRMFVIWKY